MKILKIKKKIYKKLSNIMIRAIKQYNIFFILKFKIVEMLDLILIFKEG